MDLDTDMTAGIARYRPTVASIDLNAIRANFALVKRTSGRAICGVVKADGYGHGAIPVARVLASAGIDWLGVALIEEALELRAAGIVTPVLVLGSAYGVAGMKAMLEHDVRTAVGSIEQLEQLAEAAGGRAVAFHLKIETGMGRLGVQLHELDGFLTRLHTFPNLTVEGLLSHFANADLGDRAFNAAQLDRLRMAHAALDHHGQHLRWVHMANSAAVLTFPTAHEQLVRPGLMLYGIDPAGSRHPELRPALRWTTSPIHIKSVTAGTRISYGGTWTAPRASRIATLPVGYADGYPRAVSNRGQVLIHGRRAPIVGRVCMDLCMIDVTDIPAAKLGDEVVLLGDQGEDAIDAHELAGWADTIAYEIVCGIQRRVPRVYRDEHGA